MQKTQNNQESSAAARALEPPPQTMDGAAGGNVDKIRDILFGSQIKSYETRFARVEETLARETNELKETTRKRLDSLEAYFKKETEALAGRLKQERQERADQLRDISVQLKESSDAIGRKLGVIEEQTAASDSGLRSELMDESKKLLEEVHARHLDLSGLLEKRVSELRNDKADRSFVAGLLTEMAIRLSEGDFGKSDE